MSKLHRALSLLALSFLLSVTACSSSSSEASVGQPDTHDVTLDWGGGAHQQKDSGALSDAPAADLAPEAASDLPSETDLQGAEDATAPKDATPELSEPTPEVVTDDVGPEDDAEDTTTSKPDDVPADQDEVGDVAPEVTPDGHVDRVVLCGDSWSAGLVFPTQAAFTDRGYGDVVLTWEGTAVGGSQASQWAHETAMHDTLMAALDLTPPAEVLILVISGNDLLSKIASDGLLGGYGEWPGWMQQSALDEIQADVQAIVDDARAGRPGLQIVLVGYDYLHYEFLAAYAGVHDMDFQSFNEAIVDLDTRKRAVADATPDTWYAHNFGLLQYRFGDHPHVPFTAPLLTYGPEQVPFPGVAPDYAPYPGGLIQLPGPLDYLPDGLHPNETGFRAIIDNVLDQGLEDLLNREGWL